MTMREGIKNNEVYLLSTLSFPTSDDIEGPMTFSSSFRHLRSRLYSIPIPGPDEYDNNRAPILLM